MRTSILSHLYPVKTDSFEKQKSRHEAQTSESSSSSKDTTSVWSPSTISTPNLPIRALDIDTLASARVLEGLSSLDKLCDLLEELKLELLSEDNPTSQYVLIRGISDELFCALLEDAEVPKGIRATILFASV
ncbi:hypothetical protein N7488_005581 [Penicillium malachiteum]|nr:hypothetical protein N7488_005581 [Penicillium malachiteum]